MSKIGLIYGSDGGMTEDVCKRLVKILGEDNIDLIEVQNSSTDEVSSYDKLILASSTWGSGDLQSDWEDFEDNLDEIDFSGKTVALLGLGDQDGYGDTFAESLYLLHEKVKAANVIGQTSTEGYDYEESLAVVDDMFLGLVIDEDNQDDLTDERLEAWANQIKADLGL
ncbi:MAG: flavodoxin [Arcobacter sp.]|nr:flavodoxin [Campylobacteraceae bacterium]PHR74377.1 MAG: flavodoxin [Arcobacter sp.]